ncbi:DNA polymerase epsilon subunit 3 [Folsomia candida]|uniref:DNA polymerase epsilon subunit 3 n=1 Tax=Folsomia candida TaxID=158441 RepID=UPI000B8F2F3F|nr:DNA polymerase epsilon subunit 3 [Folsomia candida]XP_021951805.1 DNA polymerase epsilon subunit 3 [Folsomia candida]
MAEKPEELSLPVASVSRVINDALPSGINVSMETRKTISKAASVFVLYTTATAASMSQKAGRKTMNANDVMDALTDMEFPQFKETLERLLQEYRQTQKKKKETNTAKKQSTGGGGDSKKSTSTPQAQNTSEVVELSDSDE